MSGDFMDNYIRDVRRDTLRTIKWRVETLKEQGAPSADILDLLLDNFANYPDGIFWTKDWFCEEE